MRFLLQHLQRTGAKPQAIGELGELIQQVSSLSVQVTTMAGSLVMFELLLKEAGVITPERMAKVKAEMDVLFGVKKPAEQAPEEPKP